MTCIGSYRGIAAAIERTIGGPLLRCLSRTVGQLLGVVFVTASVVTNVAAQDDSLEEIVVTGTRIARPDFVSTSPIVTVPAAVFASVGSSTVETTLNLMPQFVPNLTGTSNGVEDGQASLDLRGLGTTRTLVLVDGRRLIPSNGEGVADLNVIPPSLIENVEIITGGASATYGSDAIAGVVNLKLRRSMDGVVGRVDAGARRVTATATTTMCR